MADIFETFDANTVEPSAPHEVIPPGSYEVQIVRSEMTPTKDGNGAFLSLEMDILSGDQTGRKLFDRLNLQNANQTAVDIARRTMSAICHAIGVMIVSDSEQLHYRPMLAEVKVRPAGNDKSGTYRDAQNEVKGYAPVGGAAPQPRPAAVPAQQPAAQRPAANTKAAPAGNAALPPWKQRKTA